jgi:hypothetical protein
MTDPDRANLIAGEIQLLTDAETDDVSFDWVLIHLDIGVDHGNRVDWRPTNSDFDAAFMSLARLVDRGLVRVGHVEYVDGGPPGRVAPVRHVAEDLDRVRARVEARIRDPHDITDWAYSWWVVSVTR